MNPLKQSNPDRSSVLRKHENEYSHSFENKYKNGKENIRSMFCRIFVKDRSVQWTTHSLVGFMVFFFRTTHTHTCQSERSVVCVHAILRCGLCLGCWQRLDSYYYLLCISTGPVGLVFNLFSIYIWRLTNWKPQNLWLGVGVARSQSIICNKYYYHRQHHYYCYNSKFKGCVSSAWNELRFHLQRVDVDSCTCGSETMSLIAFSQKDRINELQIENRMCSCAITWFIIVVPNPEWDTILFTPTMSSMWDGFQWRNAIIRFHS